MKKYCTYLRVSTQRQGAQGLGIAAQRNMCENFIKQNGGENIKEFMDVESGTHRDRRGLWDAIDFCKKNDCSLVIAKLDRLARDVEFTFKVINTGIDIHFTDMPVVNSMILGVFASVAQYEREMVSTRTKQALAAKKARGEKLGGAASKWQETRNAKTYKERQEEADKSGSTQNSRHIQGRDFAIWVKVFQKAFPDTCSKDVFTWDTHTWKSITTRGDNKFKIIEVMKDIQDLDQTGEMFKTWDFNAPTKTLQMRIGGAIAALHNSVKRAQRYGNETTTNK